MMQKLCVLSLSVFFIYSTSFAQTNNRDNHFEVGLGLVISSDYKDAMLAAYSGDYDISGAFGWLDLEVGYATKLSKRIYFIPRLRFLISRIEIKGFSNLPSSQKANFVFLPQGSMRYNLGGKNNAFYADAHLGLVMPHSDLNRIEFDSDGIAIGAEVGTVFNNKFELGVGLVRVPVAILSGSFKSSAANFGGFGLFFRRRF
jgi:hypothetical protein